MYAVSLSSLLPHPLTHRVRLASTTIRTVPRKGRNLTERYRTLEHAHRAKFERATHVSQGSANTAAAQLVAQSSPMRVKTIAGFVVPEEPRAPADDECCMSGCAVCVYDLYEESLVAYKDSMAKLRDTLSALHIPETEWPAHIRTNTNTCKDAHVSTTTTTAEKSKGAVLDAFEEMEHALKEKRAKRAVVEAEKRALGEVLVGDEDQVRLDLRGVYEGIKWMLFPHR